MSNCHLVLYQPSIPGNTGNIGRLCVGMNAHLHLIGPMGFSLEEKQLRRAGLDYWPHLQYSVYQSPEQFLLWLGDRQPWLVTKFGQHRFDQAPYQSDDVLILGNEMKGLPPEWHDRWPDRGIAVPMRGQVRSYNLANSAAMILAHVMPTIGAWDGWQAGDLPAG